MKKCRALRLAVTLALAVALLATSSGCTMIVSTPPVPSTTAPDSPTDPPTSPTPAAPGGASATGIAIGGSNATGSPAPAATADAVAYDRSDPTTWVISFTGIGSAQLGATVAQGRAAFSALPEEQYVGCNSHVFRAQQTGSSAVPAYGFNGGVGDDENSQPVTVVYVGATGGQDIVGSAATPEGIAVGSTKQQLLAAYPDATPYSTKYEGFITYVQSDGADHYRSYSVNPEGYVQDIWVSSGSWNVPTFCD